MKTETKIRTFKNIFVTWNKINNININWNKTKN